MVNLSYTNLLRLNCGKDGYTECYIAFWMWRILPPIFLIVGTIGNTLSCVVLMSRNLRNKSASVHLTFLAGSDLLSLWMGILHETIFSVFGVSVMELSAVICTLLEWLIYTAGLFSVWLLAIVTIERVVSTKAPFFAKERLTPRKALFMSTCLLTCVAIVCLHLVYGNKFEGDTLFGTGNETVVVAARCIHRSESYTVFYNNTWAQILAFFGTIIPGSIIVLGNIVIVVSLRSRKVAPIVTSFAQTRLRYTTQQQANMLVVLSVTILIATFSFSTYKILVAYTAEADASTLARFQLYTICAYSAVWISCSSDFIVYFITGVLFRRECKKIVHSIKTTVIHGNIPCVRHTNNRV